jgi:hypothetical protein
MLKAVLLSTAALALIATSADARPMVMRIEDGRVIATLPHSGSGQSVPAGHDPGAYVIGTIDRGKVGSYYSSQGDATISGPTSYEGCGCGVAEQFIPSADATVSRIAAALGYLEGDAHVTLTLYADSGISKPGQILASGTAIIPLPADGSCCALTIAKIPTTNLTAGTPVWIGITAAGSDVDRAFPQVKNEVNDYHYVSYTSDSGSTWSTAFASTKNNPAVGLK